MTQDQLAEAMGRDKRGFQPTISKWERGEAEPQLDEIAELERAAGRPLGWVLVRAGFVSETPGVEEAIAADKRLNDEARDHLTWAYRAALAEAKRRR